MRDTERIDNIRKTASGLVLAAAIAVAALFAKLLIMADFADPCRWCC